MILCHKDGKCLRIYVRGRRNNKDVELSKKANSALIIREMKVC